MRSKFRDLQEFVRLRRNGEQWRLYEEGIDADKTPDDLAAFKDMWRSVEMWIELEDDEVHRDLLRGLMRQPVKDMRFDQTYEKRLYQGYRSAIENLERGLALDGEDAESTEEKSEDIDPAPTYQRPAPLSYLQHRFLSSRELRRRRQRLSMIRKIRSIDDDAQAVIDAAVADAVEVEENAGIGEVEEDAGIGEVEKDAGAVEVEHNAGIGEVEDTVEVAEEGATEEVAEGVELAGKFFPEAGSDSAAPVLRIHISRDPLSNDFAVMSSNANQILMMSRLEKARRELAVLRGNMSGRPTRPTRAEIRLGIHSPRKRGGSPIRAPRYRKHRKAHQSKYNDEELRKRRSSPPKTRSKTPRQTTTCA